MDINFELYVKQNNRWLLEAHFQSHQREEALDDAKQLAKQPHIQAVKVVREQRNPNTGLSRESTIWSSELKAKTGRRRMDEDDGEYADDGSDLYSLDDEDAAPNQRGAWDDFEVELEDRNWSDYGIADDEDDTAVGTGRDNARPAVRAATAVSGPEAVVLTKILVIVAASLAFAALVTWMIQRGGF